MPIAKTKKELLEAIETEYRLLKKCIGGLGPDERELPGVCHEWSAKDVMAHLVEWKKMFSDGTRRACGAEIRALPPKT